MTSALTSRLVHLARIATLVESILTHSVVTHKTSVVNTAEEEEEAEDKTEDRRDKDNGDRMHSKEKQTNYAIDLKVARLQLHADPIRMYLL